MKSLLRNLWGTLAAALLVTAAAGLGGPTAAQDIFLNEATIQGTEKIELYNPNGTAVDLSGWEISGANGTFTIPNGTSIPAADYLTITLTGDIIANLGGWISIADFAGGDPTDRVNYGQQGGAPLPHAGGTVSLCRAPDASADPPLYNEAGYSDAGNWTLDLTSTFDAANDAPSPSLGSSVALNEYNSGPPNMVEFYNPSVLATPVDLTGWFLTDGTTEAFLAGVVPSGGVLVLNLSTDIDLAQLAYLFDDQGVRVDQLGFLGAPPLDPTQCLMRCPDGAGPYDGFDWPTSGGGASLFIGECTLGELNASNPDCNGVPTVTHTWGQLRLLYR